MSAHPATVTKPSLTLRRRLNAAPSKVFAAWIEPEKLARWFGPAGVHDVKAEIDPRVGGRYRIEFRGPNGEAHGVAGVYREVVPGERLSFTWAWRTTPERESVVTVALRPDGEGTWLTLVHEQFFDEGARDRHSRGWTGSLDKLEAYFATA